MAATGKTPILLYGSTTATNVPVAGNLTNSSDGCEIAINVADKNLFFKDSTNAVNTVPIRQSSGSSDGWLSSANWTTFNSKQAAYTNLTTIGSLANATGWLYNNGSGTFSYSTPSASDVGAVPTTRTISTTAPLSGGGDLSANRTLSITQATTSTDGYLSSTDWNTFNNKASAFTYTTGYITFGQGTTTPTQNSNLFWDNSNFRLGIGSTSPLYSVDIRASNSVIRSLGAGSASVDTRGIFANSGNGGANRGVAISLQPSGSNSTVEAVKIVAYQTTASATANNASLVFQVANSSGTLTEYQRINNAGDITVSAGNLVIGTSGKGIDFSATAGTGTSELLADYEEGTWTPTDASGAGLTLTASGCTYVKIGKLVTLYGFITYPATASAATVLIGGIPYANATNNNGTTAPWTNNSLAYTVISTLTQLFLRTSANADLTNAQMSGKFVAFSVTYQAST